jgi:hypothetical protein
MRGVVLVHGEGGGWWIGVGWWIWGGGLVDWRGGAGWL